MDYATAERTSNMKAASEDIEVTRFRVNTIPLNKSDIIAHFDVKVGHFHLRKCALALSHDNEQAFIILPGKRIGNISIDLDAPFRDDILDEVCWLYQEQRGIALKTKTWP